MLGPLVGSLWFLGFICQVGGDFFVFLSPGCGLVFVQVSCLVALFVGFVCVGGS